MMQSMNMSDIAQAHSRTFLKIIDPHFRFECHTTVEFEKSFRKLDKPAQKKIDRIIQEVLFIAPYESKKLCSPQFKGKRSVRIGDFRIIIAICAECRQLHEDRFNNCCDCNRYGTNNVMIFLCGHRNHIYDS